MVETKLQEIRRRLLDLTRRNRLLNHTGAGQGTLQIVDELPAQVYGVLVDDGRAMQFLSREEAPQPVPEPPPQAVAPQPPREPLTNEVAPPGRDVRTSDDHAEAEAEAEPPPHDLPLAPVAASAAAERHKDKNLQTLLTGEKLQTRLVFLAREAASALQEQGYNVLYLTLGVVEWREVGAEAVTSRAPLVFVPVELKRKTVNTRYSVQLFEDDVLTNPCLAELCQNQFGFELPVLHPEEGEIDAYFQRVTKAIEAVDGWRFHPEIHLGLFSFSKLLMYRDLDPQSWPDPARLTAHPLVCQLTGWTPDGAAEEQPPEAAATVPDPSTLDDAVKPADCFQVVDADSSQQAAILAAKHGVSMVIDGPPGTGKSQTITNIIGECLADGRTVLFVSEKAAALEVVKRRLEGVGLGDFVLELHSRKTSKKSVMQELQRTLDREPDPGTASEQTAAAELEVARGSLNAYRRELHEPLGALEISPFAAMSRAIALAAEPDVACDIPDVVAWTQRQLTDAEERVATLDRRLARVGNPAAHPWRGAGLKSVGISQQQRIRKACDALLQAIPPAIQAFAQLSPRLGLPPATNVRNAADQHATAEALLAMPVIAAAAVHDERWNQLDPALSQWIEQGKQRSALKSTWSRLARPDAETQDWTKLIERRRRHARSMLHFINPAWYADSKRLRSFLIDAKLPPLDGQLALLEALTQSNQLRRQIEQGTVRWADQLGPAYHGIETDWAALDHYARSAVALRQLIVGGKLTPSAALQIAPSENRADLAADLRRAQDAKKNLESAWQEWLAAIAGDATQFLGLEWPDAELSDVAERLAPLPSRLESLGEWVDFHQLALDLSDGPLASFAAWLLGDEGTAARGRAATAFRRHFYRLWTEAAFAERPSLRGFRGQDHESLIARFRDLDRRWIQLTRHRLAARLATRRPQQQAAHRQSKLGLLQAEFRKKARHMPLRKVLAAAGEVVQSIKPCFMMSPLSVAQYLAPGGLEFDVVVFDEASQVEPADAYGAVARGRQLLLVGDERQLPPTDFFARAERDNPDDPAAADEFRPADLESILSLGIVRLPHRCGLRWHYRSRHSSLIEFSNQKFYDGALRVFPSPHTDCSQMGLGFRFIDAAVYNRGTGRYNAVEARAVARAVIQHAIDHPELSLGVGTLNQPQQKAIEDEIEHLRRTETDERVEAFIAAHAAKEPFFVKNLENIQGDERDVIFLSVGFGKDANGKMTLNFGALNDEGGWRRLNVLVTRARQRCLVFSSIRYDEINLATSQSRGVAMLKEYLYAAEHGRLKDQPRPGADHDSEFEASVCRALRDRGWEVHPQVGCAGFAIDLAVVDPRAPGRYLLGIECDGATYHSSATARDRDRLRQAVLEGLGWQIHRVWSTDWFQRPIAVLETLLKRLDALKEQTFDAAPAAPSPEPVEDHPTVTATENPPEPGHADQPAPPKGHDHPDADHPAHLPPGVIPYVHRRDAAPLGTTETLLHLSAEALADVVAEIVRVEGPIHDEEAMRVLADVYQARVSPRTREKYDQALAHALEAATVARRDDFLWPPDARDANVRHRGDGCPVTKPELIAPEEFDAALRLALRTQFGLQADAAIDSTARLMGFARAGAKLKAALDDALARLRHRGEVQLDAAHYVTLSRKPTSAPA